MFSWTTLPLWALVEESRRAVGPTTLGDEVVHYSIPGIDVTGTGQVEKSETIKSAKLLLHGGEVLVSKLNPRKGRVVHVRPNILPIISSTEFVALRPGAMLDTRFLGYLLQSESVRQNLDARVQSVTRSHQRVNPSDITHLSVKVPGIAEQRRIADFLDAETTRIDRLVGMRSSQIDLIEERFQNSVSELCVPGILSEESRSDRWPWLPRSLNVVRLGYFARVQSGVTVHSARVASAGDADYPYLRVANVQDGAIDLSEVKNIRIPVSMAAQSTLRDGDVVITEANGNPDNLGRGAVWHNEVPGMVHQNHVFAIRTNRNMLLPDYVSVLLASLHGRRYFRFTSSQVGIATTSSSKVLDFPIPLAGVVQQSRIVARAEVNRRTTDQAVKLLRRQITLLAERRQALITAVVTGQIDVSTASGRGIGE